MPGIPSLGGSIPLPPRVIAADGDGKAADALLARGIAAFEAAQDTADPDTLLLSEYADRLYQRGELDEALRIHTQKELPVYERLGDVRSKAVTQGQIADILQARGELEVADAPIRGYRLAHPSPAGRYLRKPARCQRSRGAWDEGSNGRSPVPFATPSRRERELNA